MTPRIVRDFLVFPIVVMHFRLHTLTWLFEFWHIPATARYLPVGQNATETIVWTDGFNADVKICLFVVVSHIWKPLPWVPTAVIGCSGWIAYAVHGTLERKSTSSYIREVPISNFHIVVPLIWWIMSFAKSMVEQIDFLPTVCKCL